MGERAVLHRTIIVNQDPHARNAIREALEDCRDIAVVGEAVDGRDCLNLIDLVRPDAVVMQADMPRMDGAAATEQISLRWPSIVVVATVYPDDVTRAQAMIKAGALAVVDVQAFEQVPAALRRAVEMKDQLDG